MPLNPDVLAGPSTVAPIVPDWPAPAPVRALATTREGGVSGGAWGSLNLGAHCGDSAQAVEENRQRLAQRLPSAPCWLSQVHGSRVLHLDQWTPGVEADAVWTDRPGQVCAILTADCLPVLFADAQGTLVGAAHAGWRGLAEGILAAFIDALPLAPERLMAWIGPGISAPNYEVDQPVRAAFLNEDARLSRFFEPSRSGHWQADLKAIALDQLAKLGVGGLFDAKLCTSADPQRFFSHRRDGARSGRQASLIWIEP